MEEIIINKFTTKQFLLLLAVIVVIGAGVIYSITASNSAAVAKVDGKSITQDELYEAMLKENGALILGGLIENKILDLELKKGKLKVDDEEVKAEIESYYDVYGDEAGLEAALLQAGLTMDTFEKNVEKIVKINTILSNEIDVSEEEALAYFEENEESFIEPEQVEVHHINVGKEDIAKEVIKKFKDGESFTDLAAEYAPDEEGNLGYLSKGAMPAPVEEVAFDIEVDQISEPIDVDGAYHVILVTDKKAAKEADFEENKEMITELLVNQAVQAQYPEWYEAKEKEYKVKNTLKK